MAEVSSSSPHNTSSSLPVVVVVVQRVGDGVGLLLLLPPLAPSPLRVSLRLKPEDTKRQMAEKARNKTMRK